MHSTAFCLNVVSSDAGEVREANQKMQRVITYMINNYRSRSLSLESFARRGNKPKLSAIFTPVSKRTASPKAPYLPITYASPIPYQINQVKASHLSLHSHDQQQQPAQHQQPQTCLLNYLVKLARQGRQGGTAQKEQKKCKSILVIRKVTQQREEAVVRVRERMEEEFRNRRQVPIHSQLNFHRRARHKPQPSSLSPHQRTPDFANKIHRAVEEILKMRNSLQAPLHTLTPEKELSHIVMESRISVPRPEIKIAKKVPKERKKESPRKGQGDGEIGPWVLGSHDSQWSF